MRQLERIIAGHDLGIGGEVALRSAGVMANRCEGCTTTGACGRATRRLSEDVASAHFSIHARGDLQKAGARLQALAASPEFARLACRIRGAKRQTLF